MGFDPAVFIEYVTNRNDPDFGIGFRAFGYWDSKLQSAGGTWDQKTMYSIKPGTQAIDRFQTRVFPGEDAEKRSPFLKPLQFAKLATNTSGFTADPPVPNMELAVPLRHCVMPLPIRRWAAGKAAKHSCGCPRDCADPGWNQAANNFLGTQYARQPPVDQ